MPNEDFKGFEDYFRRMNDSDKKWRLSDKQIKDNIDYINQYDHYKLNVCRFMFPKQIIQAFGQEFFNQHFNRFDQ